MLNTIKPNTMLKFRFYLLGLLFIAFLVGSCEKDENVTVNESEVLADFLTTYTTTDPFPAMIAVSDVYFIESFKLL